MASLLESGRAYGEWLCGEWWGLSDFHVVLLYSLCSNEMKWNETVLKISLQHPEIKNMSEGRQGVFGRKTEAWPKFIYSEGILKTAHEARSLVQTVLKEQFNIFTRGFKIWSKHWQKTFQMLFSTHGRQHVPVCHILIWLWLGKKNIEISGCLQVKLIPENVPVKSTTECYSMIFFNPPFLSDIQRYLKLTPGVETEFSFVLNLYVTLLVYPLANKTCTFG